MCRLWCRKAWPSKIFNNLSRTFQNKGRILHRLSRLLTIAAALLIGGCGGGGGGSTSTASGASNGPSAATGQNVQTIVVDAGPNNNVVNVPYVSVTICVPGTSTCQTIDHIDLDTGSSGLRIMSSVLSPSLALPAQAAGVGTLVECAQFADGFTWGPIKKADIQLAGEKALSVPIQVIGDPAFSSIPTACSSTGSAENTVQTFGSNGVLGIGVFQQDCGTSCAQSTSSGFYYSCSGSGCLASTAGLAAQAANPVAMFASDNNGTLISLPSVPAAGTATATGQLIFGIGTQANNQLGSATVLTLNTLSGNFTTTFNGRTFGQSFIDSGSNAIFFLDSGTSVCSSGIGAGFYCPASTQNFSAVNRGTNGASSTVSFSVGNANTMFTSNPGATAYPQLAGPTLNSQTFAWGLPFFYGRNVFTAIENKSTPAGLGPYVAY
jgi:hypothetical protein